MPIEQHWFIYSRIVKPQWIYQAERNRNGRKGRTAPGITSTTKKPRPNFATRSNNSIIKASSVCFSLILFPCHYIHSLEFLSFTPFLPDANCHVVYAHFNALRLHSLTLLNVLCPVSFPPDVYGNLSLLAVCAYPPNPSFFISFLSDTLLRFSRLLARHCACSTCGTSQFMRWMCLVDWEPSHASLLDIPPTIHSFSPLLLLLLPSVTHSLGCCFSIEMHCSWCYFDKLTLWPLGVTVREKLDLIPGTKDAQKNI